MIKKIIDLGKHPLADSFLKKDQIKLEKKEKPDMVKETLRVSELVTNKIEHIKEAFYPTL